MIGRKGETDGCEFEIWNLEIIAMGPFPLELKLTHFRISLDCLGKVNVDMQCSVKSYWCTRLVHTYIIQVFYCAACVASHTPCSGATHSSSCHTPCISYFRCIQQAGAGTHLCTCSKPELAHTYVHAATHLSSVAFHRIPVMIVSFSKKISQFVYFSIRYLTARARRLTCEEFLLLYWNFNSIDIDWYLDFRITLDTWARVILHAAVHCSFTKRTNMTVLKLYTSYSYAKFHVSIAIHCVFIFMPLLIPLPLLLSCCRDVSRNNLTTLANIVNVNWSSLHSL